MSAADLEALLLLARANEALAAAGYVERVREDKPLTHVVLVLNSVAAYVAHDDSGEIGPSLTALDTLAALWTSLRSPVAMSLPAPHDALLGATAKPSLTA